MLTRPQTSLLCWETFYDSCPQEEVQTSVSGPHLPLTPRLNFLLSLGVQCSPPLVPSFESRLIPLSGTPSPSFSLNFVFQIPARFTHFSNSCPGPAVWVRYLRRGHSWASSTSVLFTWLITSHLGEWPCQRTGRAMSGSSGSCQGTLASTTHLPGLSLCPAECRGQAGEEAFLTVGPGAGVRTFWFLPAPSGPDSGRTPGCTCTRTSSQALEAAPCPLCPGAGGSPHGSWGGEGAREGWGGGAQVGNRGKRQRREREEERRDTHIHTQRHEFSYILSAAVCQPPACPLPIVDVPLTTHY